MTVVIKEWWLDQEIDLNSKVQPPVGPSITRVKCCIDLICNVDLTGRIQVQRITLARGMKKNRYNVSCTKAGQWLADQYCELAVNKGLRSLADSIIQNETRLKQEIIDRHAAMARIPEEEPVTKKSGSFMGTFVVGIIKLIGSIVRSCIKLVGVIIRKCSKKD